MKQSTLLSLLSLLIVVTLMFILTLVFLVKSERQLEDCQFECNSLQTKVYMLEELNDVIGTLYQILPSKAWAWLRAAEQMRKNEKYKAYEGIEMPLLTEKERR